MGIWDRFKGLFGTTRAGADFQVGRWTAAPMRRGTPQLLAAYKEMPWLQLLVDTVSDSFADVQWKVYRPTSAETSKQRAFSIAMRGIGVHRERREWLKSMVDAGEVVEVPGHPMLQLMADPNDPLTGRQTAKLIQTHLDLVGESFLPLDLRGNLPVGYWPLPPSAVVSLPDYALPEAEQVFRINFGRVSGVIPASQMLHLRHPDPEDPMGRGVGKGFSLGDELDTDEYAARFTKNFFYNNALPAAIMAVEGVSEGNVPALKAWKERLSTDYKGAENAGKVMITNGKVSVARLDTDFKSMELNLMRKGLQGFLRMTYKIPPEIVGDISSSNKATAYAARENLAEQCTVPRAEFMRTEFQKRVMPRFGRPGDVLDYESPVPADQELTLRVMGTFPSSFTHNEARQLAGKKPDPKLKGYLAPLPGQVEAGPKTPDAEQGGPADTTEEQSQPSNKKSDPPWASQPIV